MIEIHAFLAMFALQILVGSVLAPALFIRRVQAPVAKFPIKRFAELFPGVDPAQSGQRLATQCRAVNTGIAVLGLLLLSWLFIHMRRPDWADETVVGLLTVYLLAQVSPLAFMGWKAARSMKTLKSSLAHRKRKAVLQRRGLFDFIPPLIVFLAVLSYALFVALVLHIQPHPFPGFGGGPANIIPITLLWAFFAFLVYLCLDGRKRNPMETPADRLYTIGVLVKTFVHTGIGATVFASLTLTLGLLHMQSWEPFAVAVFFVIGLTFTAIGPRRRPTASMKPMEVSLPVADLDRLIGHYDDGRGFVIAIAHDGTSLWWLRLGITGALPVPIFAEAPLRFFWKDIDQQIQFTTDPAGAVTGAEITQGAHVLKVRRAAPEGSLPFSPPTEYGCAPA
jgi:hypothetical protein